VCIGNPIQASIKELTMATEFVRARVDAEIKKEASLVLEAIGLSVSDVMRMTLTRIAHDQALPFELVTPNPHAIAAVRHARDEGVARFPTVQDLMADGGHDGAAIDAMQARPKTENGKEIAK
jgi:DNA-damage-inducible protein J